MSGANYARDAKPDASGRWPANLIHDGSDEVVRMFPENVKGVYNAKGCGKVQFMDKHDQRGSIGGIKGDGSASRFFYCAKASAKDRDEGVAGVAGGMSGRRDGSMGSITMRKNTHPTVKPTSLMRYLVRLITPPGGLVLDPFTGSGSTGKAAVIEGFRFVGIEREPEYAEIAAARIKHADENKESYRGDGKCDSRISGGNRNAISFVSDAGNIGNAIAESGVGRGLHGGQSGKKLHAEAFVRQMEIDFHDKQ
jgi:hypothetical protein